MSCMGVTVTCPTPLTCGSQGVSNGPTLSTIISDILAAGGAIGTLVSAIKVVLASVVKLGGTFSLLGLTAPYAVWFGAVVGALVTYATVVLFYAERCLDNPATLKSCSAGVIQAVIPAFNSATDELFPFTAMHDRVDVVVKCEYWPLVVTNSLFVECNVDPDTSPMIRCYYKTSAVCAAGLGSTIGGGVGVVGGILLGVLAGAAIGCATVILCIFALLAALIIAAVTVLVAALVGGLIGQAAAGGSNPATASDGTVLTVGDYVSTCGGVLTSGDDDGSRVYWFVNTTILHGKSSGSAPFDHSDPDCNLIPDACPTCAAAGSAG
jgi:hypothetical protein